MTLKHFTALLIKLKTKGAVRPTVDDNVAMSEIAHALNVTFKWSLTRGTIPSDSKA